MSTKPIKKNQESELLQEQIIKLEKQLESFKHSNDHFLKNKLFLHYDIKEPEKVVVDCETKLPVLAEVDKKKIQKGNESDPTHLLLEGDNYHALSVLNYTHAGKVDLIYIDPPYNTGSNDFIYNDRFVDREDSFRHSKWISFMAHRLRLAKNLLAEKGVIFISIDDNEQAHLRLLSDQIFGEENFVGMFIVENNPKGRKNGKFISVTNEYCLIYAKNIELATFRKIIPKHSADMAEDEHGDFVRRSGKRVLMGENTLNKLVSNLKAPKHYSAYIRNSDLILRQELSLDDIDKKLVKNGYKRYITFRDGKFVENTYTKEKFKELFDDESLDIREDKIYEKHFSDLMQIKSLLTNDEYEAIIDNKKVLYKIDLKTTSAKQQLAELLGYECSIFPKNVSFIKHLISLHPNISAVVLDFFAGSGTTGHAVLQLNKEDSGTRQFILCSTNDEKESIVDKVLYPRIKKVIEGYGETTGIPANLRYFQTDFVEKSKNNDQARADLVASAVDMINVREATYEKLEVKKGYVLSQSATTFTAIIFDSFKLADIWKEIEKKNTGKLAVKLYIFSFSDDTSAFTDMIPKNTKLDWESKSIPEGILQVYQRLFKKKEK